jgi:mannose-6-phosphate isomerase-like protein (cupin superfamily)
MSADKIPTITESALSNKNARTVLHATLAPDATTFPHYHTLFSETFTLLTGSMTVYTSPDITEASFQAKNLEIGESVTVPLGQLHNFLVGDEETTSKVTFEPGNLDFERAMMIMRGTQGDGIYQEHGMQTAENAIYMAVMGELLNASAVGETKGMLDGLYAVKGDEIQAKKRELVARYASDEQMQINVKQM